MKKKGIHILATTVLCLSTISCSDSFDTSFFEKEREDLELILPIGLPIGYINYTASQLFEELNDELTVGSGTNDIISFSYTQTLDGSGNSDFVSVDNQNFDGDFDLLADANIPEGGYEYGTIEAADLLIGESRTSTFKKVQSLAKAGGAPLDYDLTAATFSGGDLIINLTTTTEAETAINFRIPSLINKFGDRKGLSYNRDFLLKSHSSTPNVNTVRVNLSNYDFDFSLLNPNDNSEFNNLAVEIEATITFADGDNISSSDKLNYTITLDSPVVEKAEGDFKQGAFNVDQQTFALDFFKEIGSGSLIFENPILTLSATNQFGFPIGLVLDNISTDATANNLLMITDTSSNQIAANTDAGFGNYAIIDAGLNTENGGVTSSIVLDNNNSNLAALLGENPTEFRLDVSGTSNPNSPSGNNNFFNASNGLSIDVNVELPLNVTFDNVEFTPDPIALDLGEDIQENAKTLSLRVATKNTIPFNGTITLDFLDANASVLFSKTIKAIVAAPIGADGFSTYTLDANNNLKDSSGTIIDANVPMNGDEFAITFDASDINNLGNATEVQLSLKFDTDINNDGNATPVRVRNTDQVRIDLALKGDIIISTNN